MFASLLVGLDGSRGADAALDAAIALGRRFDSTIMLGAVVDLRVMEAPLARGAAAAWTQAMAGVPAATLELGELMKGRADKLLAAGAERVTAAGLSAATARENGMVEEELLKLAEEAEALVVGRRGELSGGDDVGENTVRLIRRAPRPVVVAGESPSAFGRPVVAWDGSEHAAAALTLASRYATHAGVPLDVVHVGEAAGESLLAQAAAFLSRTDVSYETHLLAGAVPEAIGAFARRRGSDVLVCGAHGRRHSWTMGSTAEALVRHTDLAAIVVR